MSSRKHASRCMVGMGTMKANRSSMKVLMNLYDMTLHGICATLLSCALQQQRGVRPRARAGVCVRDVLGSLLVVVVVVVVVTVVVTVCQSHAEHAEKCANEEERVNTQGGGRSPSRLRTRKEMFRFSDNPNEACRKYLTACHEVSRG